MGGWDKAAIFLQLTAYVNAVLFHLNGNPTASSIALGIGAFTGIIWVLIKDRTNA